MKLQEIRRNAELVSSIRKISEDPAFRVLLEMLEDEHPRRSDIGAGATVYDVARLHDRQVAYELAISNIKKAGIFIQPHEEVKQDYEKETL